jgi:hypothetical protein
MPLNLTLPTRFQGATGNGHGGYTAGLMAESAPGRRTVDFYVTIPLDAELTLVESDSVQRLERGDETIARTRPTDKAIQIPAPVSIADASEAQRRSPVHVYDVLPDCFSCGTRSDSMDVHAGPLEGRAEFATTWTPAPETAADGRFRPSVTGEMWDEVFERVRPEETYVLVAWGNPWRGRRATAGTSLFDASGRCVAAAESMWIAI